MNLIPLLAESLLPSGWQGLLFQVAIGVIIIWAIYALLKWSEIKLPRPVVIIFIALASILAVIWLFKLFNALV